MVASLYRAFALVVSLLAFALVCLPNAAFALIEDPLPLERLLNQSKYVVVAKVARVSAERYAMVLEVETDLKGMFAKRRFTVDLTADDNGEANKLFARLGKESKVIITLAESLEGEKVQQYIGLFYFDGSWFQLLGTPAGEEIAWHYTHAEPYLRRTFKGSTAELQKAIEEYVAMKAPAPPLDEKEKPGLGAELPEDQRAIPLIPSDAPIPTTAAGETGHAAHSGDSHDAPVATAQTGLSFFQLLIYLGGAGVLIVVAIVAFVIAQGPRNSSTTKAS